MCGIFCSIQSSSSFRCCVPESLNSRLRNRGPDFQSTRCFGGCMDDDSLTTAELTMSSTVLHMQDVVLQPYCSSCCESTLLFNGELYLDKPVRDTVKMFEIVHNSDDGVLGLFNRLLRYPGPFAFVFYSAHNNNLVVCRDVLGRKSLLISICDDGTILISSVASRKMGFIEIPSGIVMTIQLSKPNVVNVHIMRNNITIDLFCDTLQSKLCNVGIKLNVHQTPSIDIFDLFHLNSHFNNFDHHPLPQLDSDETSIPNLMQTYQSEVKLFVDHLLNSVKRRVVGTLPDRCNDCFAKSNVMCGHSKVAILFSGGVDSLIIAALVAKCLPVEESIDLYNVAFERTIKTGKGKHVTESVDFLVPDRLTGMASYQTLKQCFPSRQFNFVCVDVPKSELVHLRESRICELVLDDSIGCALWFASRGEGHIVTDSFNEPDQPYKSNARVLLTGGGADELLGGYGRHRVRFQQYSWQGLHEELEMELSRYSVRNLGRDDRICSDHSRELRLPFLDENFVRMVNRLPLHVKCDMRLPRGTGEKMILRLGLCELGFSSRAFEPKRAMQFGSRIAKLENSKEKGNDICDRLL